MSPVRIGEVALAILRRGGLSNARAIAAFSGIIALNYGWSSFTTARDLDPEGPSDDVSATLAQLPRTEYPLTVDHHYDFVLDQLLSGLAPLPTPRQGNDPVSGFIRIAADLRSWLSDSTKDWGRS